MSTPEHQSRVENLKAKLARKQHAKHTKVTDYDSDYQEQADDGHINDSYVNDSSINDSSINNSHLNDSYVNSELTEWFDDELLENDNQTMETRKTRKVIKRTADYEIAELLSQKFWGVNLFLILMLGLSVAILWTGVATATQIQHYREDYKALQNMKQEYRKLQVEHKRLLIEQQTFSATSKIASRALGELNMFFPTFQDKMILQPITDTAINHTPNSTSHLTQQSSATSTSSNEVSQ